MTAMDSSCEVAARRSSFETADRPVVAFVFSLPLYPTMSADLEIVKLALAHFPLPAEAVSSSGRLWLTLYLFGSPDSYARTRPLLEAEGWKNLGNADDYAGFTYPKKEIANDEGQVRDALVSALAICDTTGMGLDLIDADAGFDSGHSTFRTLYKKT